MVLLDIGAGVGALVVTVPDEWLGRELEISPRGLTRARSHTVARRRQVPAGSLVAAVFPAVPAGDHDVWAPDGSWLGTVRVTAGRVAELARREGSATARKAADAGRASR